MYLQSVTHPPRRLELVTRTRTRWSNSESSSASHSHSSSLSPLARAHTLSPQFLSPALTSGTQSVQGGIAVLFVKTQIHRVLACSASKECRKCRECRECRGVPAQPHVPANDKVHEGRWSKRRRTRCNWKRGVSKREDLVLVNNTRAAEDKNSLKKWRGVSVWRTLSGKL